MAKLEVQIGADSGEFMTEVAKVEKQLANLKSQQAANLKLGIDTSAINNQINETTTKLNTLKGTIGSSAAAFDNHSKSAANGGNTLMQFSRIAQDAPFGIMGIGNNLTATAESFSYLAKSSGGAGNALKAVASSIMGTGGILLAVSLVTTGLTIMSQQGLSVSDVFNKLTGNFDGFANTLKTASQEATKSAIEETGALKGLIAIAQDETQTKKMRLEAVDQLQKTYPNYFGNLSKEEIMYSNLTGVVNEVTKALINKAIAEKMSEKAAEPTLKLWEANARLIKQREEATKAEAAYQKAASNPAAAGSMQFYASASARAAERLKETRQEVIALNKEVAKYDKVITMASQNAAKVILKPGASAKPKKAQKEYSERNVGAIALPKAADLVGLDDKEFQLAKDRIGRDGELIKTYGKAGEFVKANLVSTKEAVQSETIQMLMALANFNDAATDIINNSISNTFAGLGESIGSAMSTGANVLQAAGSALLAGLGGVLTDMGKMAIQIGVGMLGIKAALKTLNPYAAIAAGIALVALGSIFSSKSKAIGGSMGSSSGSSGSGGSSGGNIQTGASVSSPTSSVSSGGTFNNSGGTVVFEIAGQKLIGVLNNTLQGNLRLGGSGLAG
jgi:hypothetical protein